MPINPSKLVPLIRAPRDRQRELLTRIQDECLTIREGSSATLLRAKLNSVCDIAALLLRELDR